MQRVVLLVALVAFAGLIATAMACSDSSTSDQQSASGDIVARPTTTPWGTLPPWLSVANGVARNPHDAAGFAREILEVERFSSKEIDSMAYVEATVGAARNVLDPKREAKTWDT
jgi:hypothetical protein